MNPVTRGMAVYQVRDDAKLGLGYKPRHEDNGKLTGGGGARIYAVFFFFF